MKFLFNGQGLHSDGFNVPSFSPSHNFTVSTKDCSPFTTLVGNVLMEYNESNDEVKAKVYPHDLYDGETNLPVTSNEATGFWLKSVNNALNI